MERARSLRDGPPKKYWSVWRPHVVCTLTLGAGLTKVDVLRSEAGNDDESDGEVAKALEESLE